MPVYLCRWPNGSVSIVQAPKKLDAIERLDEFDNAEGCDIRRMNELLLDLHIDDEGELQLGQLGEGCENEIRRRAYPKLEEAWLSDELQEMAEASPEYRAKVREVVEQERTRLQGKKGRKVRPPKTELGKRIKEQSGAASVLVDRWVEEIGEDILDKLDDEAVQ